MVRMDGPGGGLQHSAIRTGNFSADLFFGRNVFWPICFRPNNFLVVFFFRRGGLGGGRPPSFNHFKKFARRANFLKWCRGGVWGGEAPLRNLRYPCLAPVPCPQFTRTIYAYDLRIYAYEIRKLLR